MIESAVATAVAAAGTAGIDELLRLRVISPALDALQPAPLADQPAAVLDGLLREAFPLLTQPSSHVGSAATEAWRGVFTLAAVLRAAALLDNEHWAPAARLLDLALLLQVVHSVGELQIVSDVRHLISNLKYNYLN